MIRNFASDICHSHIGDGWVTRFLHCNHDHLISKWTTGMDCTRQKADSTAKYKLYLDLLHGKIEDYSVLPANMYNPNEKDFMTGVTCKRLDLCWPQWVNFGLQEHHRTSWNSMESHGTSWNPTEPHGIPRNLMESHRPSWNPTEPHGTLWNLMESHGRFWNMAESSGC
jgi:hypothetical protein